jgi:ABC-type arginine/histidine transport system permease subunit
MANDNNDQNSFIILNTISKNNIIHIYIYIYTHTHRMKPYVLQMLLFYYFIDLFKLHATGCE